MGGRHLYMVALALCLVTASSPAWALGTSSNSYRIDLTGPPVGFENLEQPRELLVDVYFGGTRVGEARIVAKPGSVQFESPDQVIGNIPKLRNTETVVRLLSSALPSNSSLACSQTNITQCRRLSPEVVGIIFDEDRLRVDVFVHPDFLEATPATAERYLSSPTAPVSLTSSMGLALSGSSGSSPTYNLQNRTIVGFRSARLRSDSSVASGLGLTFDDLAVELDTKQYRYSGGLFWAPGLDLTGRRRIIGMGFETQFDTRADRESLSGTPLLVFLSQPARIEILMDGRLVTSGSYQAGNNFLDTSSLPSGSYPVVLRIREVGGATREERRFFVKNAQVAPMGEQVYFAYAGLLANTRRNHPISVTRNVFYEAGTARRLSQNLALDASVLGTDKKAMIEAGAWLLTRRVRVRAAGLVSSSGDRGVLLQLGSSGGGRLNFNFDLRQVWSGHGEPLIPLPSNVDNFGSIPPTGAQVANGTYTQASGSIAMNFGPAYVSVIGSYRRDHGAPADYSIGPSLNWPIVNRNGLQVVFQADAQQTRTSTATFIGFRALFTSGSLSMSSSSGRGSIRSRDGGSPSSAKMVGRLSGQWSYQDENLTQATIAAGYDRNLESTTANLNATVNSRFGGLRADVLKKFDNGGSGLQYGLTYQSGVAATGNAVGLGGRDLNESALIASVGGSARGTIFEVLVDELPRGRIHAGGRLPIFLQAYRKYKVRLKPVGSDNVDYDAGTREITLFPGNVANLRWQADSLITLFGRAVNADGKSVSNATIQSRRGVGQTDEDGYFQVDAENADVLVLTTAGGGSCKIPLNQVQVRGDYASIGKVVCR